MSTQANDFVTKLTEDYTEKIACELFLSDDRSRVIISAFLYQYGAELSHQVYVETLRNVVKTEDRPLSKKWRIKAKNFAGTDNGNIRTFSVVGINENQAIVDLRKRFPLAGDTIEIRNLYRSTWEPCVTHKDVKRPARFLYPQDRSF